MCQKSLGERDDMDVAAARSDHHAVITRLMQGPGDSEGAMHRAERMSGLPYWAQFNLRYKHRATVQFIGRVRQAYLSMLETSVRRDLEKLKTEQAKGLADVSIENLITEAENLLGRIAGKSPAEKA